jgi:hypothetical protein
MIIVKLMGGLGNQMFQYAIGRRISLEHKVPLKLDLSFLLRRDMGPDFTHRSYDLDMFVMDADLDPIVPEGTVTIKQPHFQYSPEVVEAAGSLLKSGRSIVLEGHWQTPKYFESYSNQIHIDFEFRNKVQLNADFDTLELLRLIESTNSVMINIRRTDYLKTNFHGVMGVDYITKASSILEEKVAEAKYFVFSDDIEWCKEHICLPNTYFVDHIYSGNRFEYYLQLMKSCKHFIIPNSTFAWWSAWLNNSKEKLVIAPKNWFSDSRINTTDLVPSGWIRI